MATLRSATDADIDTIAQVWHDGWREAHLGLLPVEIERFRRLPDFQARAALRRGDTTVAVEEDDRVVGFVMVHDNEIEQLYVAPHARSTGVADRLLRHGERTISARGDLAWLAVIEANPRALRFYRRNGWYDAGAFDYEAPAGQATITVNARRYEKRLATCTGD
jgi:ribosomal protein S18 acetylase RimI-like enzyme